MLLHLKVRCAELSIFYFSSLWKLLSNHAQPVIMTQTVFSVLFLGTAFESGTTLLTWFTLQWLDQDERKEGNLHTIL